MTTVLHFSVSHNPNAQGTWTHGDVVSGHIRLDLGKECHILSLMVKLKGHAEVHWSTGKSGKSSGEEYFSFFCAFIGEKNDLDPSCNVHLDVGCDGCDGQIIGTRYKCMVCPDYNLCSGCQSTRIHEKHLLRPIYLDPLMTDERGKPYSNVVAPGSHIYPFTFQFPVNLDLPPTFKGEHGSIRYTLEAYLSRTMTLYRYRAIAELAFIPTHQAVVNPELMNPQHHTKEKEMKLFTSGTVAMDVKLDKMGYYQGEEINVVASIQNNSSRDIKPKYCFYTKHSFFARKDRNLDTKDLLKMVGDVIPPSCHQTVTKTITLPFKFPPSILNCNIIKVEYRLRVYLDVKYASDPHIKFPIVVMLAPGRQAVPRGPPAYGPQPAFEAPGGKPGFGAPGGQPAFGTPRAQLAFGGPGGPPSFGASGGPPASGAPSGQPPALSNPTQSGDASSPSSENFL